MQHTSMWEQTDSTSAYLPTFSIVKSSAMVLAQAKGQSLAIRFSGSATAEFMEHWAI